MAKRAQSAVDDFPYTKTMEENGMWEWDRANPANWRNGDPCNQLKRDEIQARIAKKEEKKAT